ARGCAWLALLCAMLLGGATPIAMAELATRGTGNTQVLIRDQFSPEMRARYDIFAHRCTKCHAMARPIAALNTGITPVTGGTFDEDGIRKYVARMMRKPNSGIERTDAREILQFLIYARALSVQNGRLNQRSARGPR